MRSTGVFEQLVGKTLAICPPELMVPVLIVMAHDWAMVSGLLEISSSHPLVKLVTVEGSA
jgi:hypothetical protein